MDADASAGNLGHANVPAEQQGKRGSAQERIGHRLREHITGQRLGLASKKQTIQKKTIKKQTMKRQANWNMPFKLILWRPAILQK